MSSLKSVTGEMLHIISEIIILVNCKCMIVTDIFDISCELTIMFTGYNNLHLHIKRNVALQCKILNIILFILR